MSNEKNILVYTDGACSGNPGPGGYGIVMQLEGSHYKKEFSAGYRKTTNNRMELLAVIVALEKVKWESQKVKIYTDSKYVHDSLTKGWVYAWVKKGFKDKKNEDLWRRLLPLYKKHEVEMIWVKGHAGHPGNERADQLAVAASKNKELLIDEAYEQSINKHDTLL